MMPVSRHCRSYVVETWAASIYLIPCIILTWASWKVTQYTCIHPSSINDIHTVFKYILRRQKRLNPALVTAVSIDRAQNIIRKPLVLNITRERDTQEVSASRCWGLVKL